MKHDFQPSEFIHIESFLNYYENEILISIRKKIQFKLITITLTLPTFFVILLSYFENSNSFGISEILKQFNWYLHSLPFIGIGSSMPTTILGQIVGVLIYLTNYLLLVFWLSMGVIFILLPSMVKSLIKTYKETGGL